MSTQGLLAVIFNIVMVALLLFAWLKGGKPERIGVAINLVGFTATTLFRLLERDIGWAPGEIAILAIDACVAVGFYGLAVTTIRFWPIWAAGFAVADLCLSVFGALLPRVTLFAYHTGLGIYAYLALGALALGTLRLPRDARSFIRNGSRRSWLQNMNGTS